MVRLETIFSWSFFALSYWFPVITWSCLVHFKRTLVRFLGQSDTFWVVWNLTRTLVWTKQANSGLFENGGLGLRLSEPRCGLCGVKAKWTKLQPKSRKWSKTQCIMGMRTQNKQHAIMGMRTLKVGTPDKKCSPDHGSVHEFSEGWPLLLRSLLHFDFNQVN